MGSSFIKLLTLIFLSPPQTGAIEPVMCPAGYGEMIGALRVTKEDTCAPCRAGTYSSADGSGCLPCQAGVVCMDMATTDNPVTNSSDLAYIFGPNGTQAYLCPPGKSHENILRKDTSINQEYKSKLHEFERYA